MKIGHPPVTFVHRDLAEISNMIRPLTKLAPWRAASRVTGKVSTGLPAGTGGIPPAARSSYPKTVPARPSASAPTGVRRPRLATAFDEPATTSAPQADRRQPT